MMTAPGRVRPSPGPVEATPRVLCVGATSESWLALSRALRPLRCVALQVPSLESAFLEVQHTRPSLVLVHWRQLVAGAGMGLRALRLRLGGDGPPVVLVAEPETPAEVLEVGDAEAVQLWGCSSVGRASRSQCEGRRFDPVHLHHATNEGPHGKP